jgi:CheY-like chemotaxis protein
MSYPLVIQALVIEDEPDVKETYEQIFKRLADRYDLAPRCYAFSYDQAETLLQQERIFHLVILDLKLPESVGIPAAEGLDFGEALLSKCADRNDYPIPSLLISSAHVDDARDQDKLRQVTGANFAYGQVLVKSARLEGEIAHGIDAAIAYCNLGIHIRDSGDRRYPTLNPREDDLLRRVLMAQRPAIGVDLEWWSADTTHTLPTMDPEWTKVLMGRILLRGDRPSRPNFFKFMPAHSGFTAIEAAERLHQKLSHVKLKGSISSSGSALIVTEKAGAADARPIPLYDFLAREVITKESLSTISTQVVEQIEALGDRRPQSRNIKGLLWPFHDSHRISTAWERYAPKLSERFPESTEPVDLYKRLTSSDEVVIFTEQTFLHGDLHLGNIALDVAGPNVAAFVFDAGGTAASLDVRDIAALEVSVLLHQEFETPLLLVMCDSLYRGANFVPPAVEVETAEPRNSYELI